MTNIPINFVPYRLYARQKSVRRFQVTILYSAIFAIGVAFLLNNLLSLNVAYQGERNQFLSEQIRLQEITFEKIKKMKKDIYWFVTRVNVFQKLAASRYSALVVLYELSAIIPNDCFLDKVKMDDQTIEMDGFGRTNDVVSQLISRMNHSAVLHFLTLSETRSVEVGELTFQHFYITAKRNQ